MNEALNACVNNTISLHAVTLPSLYNTFSPITNATNGGLYNFNDDYSGVLQSISGAIGYSYTVYYDTENNSCADDRNLEIIVSYGGNQASAEISYTPCEYQEIQPTPSTVSLHESPLEAGVDLNLEMEITDYVEPYTQNVTVYYKNPNQTNFTAAPMTNSTREGVTSNWVVTIPGSAVQTPGLDYYVSASDGTQTSSYPMVEPMQNPVQLAVMPNEAPLLVHNPIAQFVPEQSIEIIAEVTDETDYLETVSLFYRQTGQLIYEQTVMEAIYTNRSAPPDDDFGVEVYIAEIPAYVATEWGVEYYIEARDNYNVKGYMIQDGALVSADNPIQILPGSCLPPIDFQAQLLANNQTVALSWQKPVTVKSGLDELITIIQPDQKNPDQIKSNETLPIRNDIGFALKHANDRSESMQTPFDNDKEQVLLHYDGPNYNAVGLASGGIIYAAVRFSANMLAQYQGYRLEDILIYISDLPAGATEILVWNAGTPSTPGNLVHQQAFVPTSESWMIVGLNNNVILDGNDLWVGYKVTHAGNQYPAGIDAGPAHPDGNWTSTNGINWQKLTDYDIDYNWNIRARLSATQLTPEPIAYKIYRNTVLIATVPATTFSYMENPGTGVFNYGVSAVYDHCESEPAGPVSISISTTPDPPVISVTPASLAFGNVEVNTFSAPQSYQLTGSNLTHNITVTAPTHYQVSLNPASGFASSLTVAPTGGGVNTTIYVRFNPGITGGITGHAANASTGASTAHVFVSGTGIEAADPVCPPPVNLQAEVVNNNSVLLHWEPPQPVSKQLSPKLNDTKESIMQNINSAQSPAADIINKSTESLPWLSVKKLSDKGMIDAPVMPKENKGQVILRHDNDNTGTAVGLGESGILYAAAKFPATMVSPYTGYSIDEVLIRIMHLPAESDLMIWDSGTETSPGSLIHQQTFLPIANAWNTISLNDELYLDGQDIWIGYKVTVSADAYPCGIDVGPAVVNGDWGSTDGSSWFRLSELPNAIDNNWNLRAVISDDDPSLTLIGYNLYRDGTLIESFDNATLQHTDGPLSPGSYAYSITALYDECESELTSPVEVQIHPSTYSLSLYAEPANGGEVEGAGVFEAGEIVPITANPSAGYVFSHWSGDTGHIQDASAAHTNVDMPAENITLYANFTEEDLPPQIFIVSFNVVGSNGTLYVSVDGNPIDNGDTVEEGKTVVFEAQPDEGYHVKKWRHNGVDIVGYTAENYAVHNLSENIIVTVEFEETPPNAHIVNFHVDGGSGTLSAYVDGNAIESGDAIEEGKTVVFEAEPEEGFQVKKWRQNGIVVSPENPHTYTVPNLSENITVSIEFEEIPPDTHVVVFHVQGANGTLSAYVDDIAIQSGEAVEEGKTLVFQAEPEEGFQVKQWRYNGMLMSGYVALTFTFINLTADITVTVEFEPVPDMPELSAEPQLLGFNDVVIDDCVQQNYLLTGENLTGNVTVSAPESFLISTNAGMGFSESLVVEHNNGIANQYIYVQFCPTAEQTYSGIVTNSSPGANTVNVVVSGNGYQEVIEEGNILKIHNLEATAGDIITINIEIINDEEFFSFVLHNPLPEGFSYIEGTAQLFRSDGHFAHVNVVLENTVHVISTSIPPKPFIGQSGIILSYDLQSPEVAGEYVLDFTDALIADAGGNNIMTSGIPGTINLVDQDITYLNDHVVYAYTEVCFSALGIIYVGGEDGFFIVEDAASATLIAGQSIHLLPGTTVEHGGYLMARIAAHDDDYCGIPLASEIDPGPITAKEDVITTEYPYEIRENGFFKLYPNPTDCTFTLELTTLELEQSITVEVHSTLGGRLFTKELATQRLHSLSLEGQQPGMYIIRVIKGEKVGVERLIKR